MKKESALIWVRKDLRTLDNPALFHACQEYKNVHLVFLLSSSLRSRLGQAQEWWLWHSLQAFKEELQELNLSITIKKDEAKPFLHHFIKQKNFSALYWNCSQDPLLRAEEEEVQKSLKELPVRLESFDRSLVKAKEILNQQGGFFKVFTPFYRKAKENLSPTPPLKPPHKRDSFWNSEKGSFFKASDLKYAHAKWAEKFSSYWTPGEKGGVKLLRSFCTAHLAEYQKKRDYPEGRGTSLLSPHLCFGELSPNLIIYTLSKSLKAPLSEKDGFVRQLFWREFCFYHAWYYPALSTKDFQGSLKSINWRKSKKDLSLWQKGLTGYPIIDAGMRELWEKGWMHNRLRMLTASFLVKNLRISWKEGLQHFRDTLLDGEESVNAFNWQWVAGCGADAAPYFRIFNPLTQAKRFDPEASYSKAWLPELKNLKSSLLTTPEKIEIDDYPKTMVDLSRTREEFLLFVKRER